MAGNFPKETVGGGWGVGKNIFLMLEMIVKSIKIKIIDPKPIANPIKTFLVISTVFSSEVIT